MVTQKEPPNGEILHNPNFLPQKESWTSRDQRWPKTLR